MYRSIRKTRMWSLWYLCQWGSLCWQWQRYCCIHFILEYTWWIYCYHIACTYLPQKETPLVVTTCTKYSFAILPISEDHKLLPLLRPVQATDLFIYLIFKYSTLTSVQSETHTLLTENIQWNFRNITSFYVSLFCVIMQIW